jgi:hypothetical protein
MCLGSFCDPNSWVHVQSKYFCPKGIGFWLKCAKVEFPCELLALAYSAQGQALLEGFHFFRIQNATSNA